jgi:hypothetical protein
MIGLRDKSFRRVTALVVGLALYLQLAFASGGMLAAGAPAGSADTLAEHALCLAGEGGTPQPTAPADNAPAVPAHDHAAFCCLWHQLPSVAPQAAAAPVPVPYATVAHDPTGDTAPIPGPHRGPANARAPPALA